MPPAIFFTKKFIAFLIPFLSAALIMIGYLTVLASPLGEINTEGEEEIVELNDMLKAKREEIEDLQRQAEAYRKSIKEKRSEGFSLKNQVAILDTQIAKIKVEIKAKEQEIVLTKLDIEESELKIKQLEKKIERQKERIGEFLRVIYRNRQQSQLEILLLNDSLSEFFNQVQYIENLHSGLHEQLVELKIVKDALEKEAAILAKKKAALEEHNEVLGTQRDKLGIQHYVKEQLLEDTQESEKKFRSLLAELKEEQRALDAGIVSLEQELRKKIEEEEKRKNRITLKGEQFIWPIKKNTITAYFHDPNYPYRYIFEHPAIDIRAPQGTVVNAAASGYVAKTQRDSSCTGRYAYIMIIHADGLSTVYGHLSQIDIDEGDFVVQGQRIGLSGGMPGTCGAGRLTTGPHHHFEVRLNGIPVDPLPYLP